MATGRQGHWAPGKKCQPDLAVLLGISGQVQFTVGIRDARVIVAVNSDENAYIHQMADYSMVADLHQVVKELNTPLPKTKLQYLAI